MINDGFRPRVWNILVCLGDIGVKLLRFLENFQKFSNQFLVISNCLWTVQEHSKHHKTLNFIWHLKICENQKISKLAQKWRDVKVAVPEAMHFHFSIDILCYFFDMVRSTLLSSVSLWPKMENQGLWRQMWQNINEHQSFTRQLDTLQICEVKMIFKCLLM